MAFQMGQAETRANAILEFICMMRDKADQISKISGELLKSQVEPE